MFSDTFKEVSNKHSTTSSLIKGQQMKEAIILGLVMITAFSVIMANNYKSSLTKAHEINQQQMFSIEDRDSQIAELKLNLKYERLFSELGK